MERPAYLEFVAVGDAVRVAAICPETGIEAVVMGPASAARADLERLALAKLERLRAKPESEDPPPPPPKRGPGTWA
ncbi:MAG: serine hydroxymethyltransferase [Alphaproteobacteria bacterium]|nr:serine hydroxymethyltransferase [Alphaproteobacteria bacterium]